MKEIARRLVGNVWRTGVVEENGNGGSQPVQVAIETLVASDILNLWQTPFEIVPAPVTNMVIVPLWTECVFHPGMTQYQNGGNVYLGISPGQGGAGTWNDVIINGSAVRSASAVFAIRQLGMSSAPLYPGPADAEDPDNWTDVPILISTNDFDTFTDGDGTLTVACYYSVKDLS